MSDTTNVERVLRVTFSWPATEREPTLSYRRLIYVTKFLCIIKRMFNDIS